MSIQQKGESRYCTFAWHGRRYTFGIGKVSDKEAREKDVQVKYLLGLLKKGHRALPPGVTIAEYVQYDGHPPATAAVRTTLVELRDRFLASHENGSSEQTTIDSYRLHFKHLVKHFGPEFPVVGLELPDLQGYVDKRAQAKRANGNRLSPATIHKEIVTLRTAWNWGAAMKLVEGRFPSKGLRFPKGKEKPPYMTRQQIERRISAGALSKTEQAELWDALYLTPDEIDKVLTHVKAKARHPWIYPAVCFVAHTGARRSEMMRVLIEDVDFVENEVTLRAKKDRRGRTTTKRVKLSAELATALREWLQVHPGGLYLFCPSATVARSKKRSRLTGFKDQKTRATTVAGRLATVRKREPVPVGPLTANETDKHFDRTLAGSDWDIVKGWHVLRHSFISALASKAIDQRVIDEFVGHSTEEQRRRYRHLFPTVRQDAINAVFGAAALPRDTVPIQRAG